MLSCNLELEGRSTWTRSTPGDLERAQPFFCMERGDFLARERYLMKCPDCRGFDFLYTFEGSGTVVRGGRETRLGRGRAILVDDGEERSYGTSTGFDRWHHFWVRIGGQGVRELFHLLYEDAPRPVRLSAQAVGDCASTLEESFGRPGVVHASATGLAIHSLLVEMLRASRAAERSTEDAAIKCACDLVADSFGRPLTLDEMAGAAQVSTSYLLKVFRRNLGTTPYEYLLRFRITRAKELLAETDMRIGQIAREVGFNSESNFSYRFAKMVGQSPRSYRAGCPVRSDSD